MEINVYSDVVNNGMILDKKIKYTMRDVNSLIVNSLFNPKGTLDEETAIFIVKCSAIFHNTDWAKSLDKRLEVLRNPVKLMFG